VLLCVFIFYTGHFVMVPLNLQCSFVEHLFIYIEIEQNM